MKTKTFKSVKDIEAGNADHIRAMRLAAENIGVEHLIDATDDARDIYRKVCMALLGDGGMSESKVERSILADASEFIGCDLQPHKNYDRPVRARGRAG